MKIYLVWSGYEDVEAGFLKRENAEKCIGDLIKLNPTYGGYGERTREDFSITDLDILDA